ncbi:hypothetical protein BD626DRAFT_471954 [Schizophyllum amplum]|uniref:Uncharacterized protein n=1 Tax=Schizophyllum amplum TaxID=97359 RepID=A0A550CVJ3_9AGAR|nr:hypothetical protein BD626DRAFT_471954 [Auriculariopsis ampla]
MPKREKTPEAIPDSKFLAIYQPYPANADMELLGDQMKLARWIASIVPHKYLFALHYKPKARGMVLVEISIECQEIGSKLLGEHRWSEFLRDPSEEEMGRTSQVFYSIYPTLREAQKDGWKQISVLDAWFKEGEFRPNNPVIMHPYPPTHWCPPPPEDKTNKPICRPLPVQQKPPPPAPVRQVVGSTTWLNAKQAPPKNTPVALKGAWATKSKPVGASNAWNKPITTPKPLDEHAQQQKSAAARRQALWGGINAGPKASNVVPLDPVDALADTMAVSANLSGAVSGNQAAAISDVLFGSDDEDGVGPWSVADNDDGDDDRPPSPAQNLWSGVRETHIVPVDKIDCSIHGARCRGGICIEGARKKRERKRREEEAARRDHRDARGRRTRDEGAGAGSGVSSLSTSQVRQFSSSGGTDESDPGGGEVGGGDEGGGAGEGADEQWVAPKRPFKNGRGRGNALRGANGAFTGANSGFTGANSGFTGTNGHGGNSWAQPGAKSDWAAQGRKPRRG